MTGLPMLPMKAMVTATAVVVRVEPAVVVDQARLRTETNFLQKAVIRPPFVVEGMSLTGCRLVTRGPHYILDTFLGQI